MCKTAKDVWNSLIITHQGNKQVKDNKIDLFVQKYKEFVISDNETTDCAFARFSTIITSLKALDKSFSSRNYVRKFLRALLTKWRPKVMAIEESKDLSTLPLDELIGNLKVYEVVLEKDSEASKVKKENYKSLALKARKVSSDEEESCSGSDEEYATAVRDLKNSLGDEVNSCVNLMTTRRVFVKSRKRIRERRIKNVSRCWSESDNEDDPKKDENFLMALDNNEVLSDTLYYSSSSLDKHKNIKDESWTMAMQEELNQIITNDVWSLVYPPDNQTLIGYNQQEGIYFDETYAPVARLESVRILLTYACAHDFKKFQMDVKSAFLNGFINEEVYVAQPLSFVDFKKPNHVFKLKKASYGLKQTPKAWYDRLKAFLLDPKYTMGLVDNTLFTKKRYSHIIIVQIYMDDIIFGSTCQDLCDDFSKIMHDEFEMSMMEDSKPIKTPMSSETKLSRYEDGESVYDTKYRGMIGSLLYLTACHSDIMLSVCLCRFQKDPKISHLEAIKRIFRYVKGTTHLGLWYPKRTGVETIVYANIDHAGDYVDLKSTSGVCTFMGCCLTSWFSKKQTTPSISTTKTEYVFAEKDCQQALWMKQALVDYDIKLDDIPILCDKKGAILKGNISSEKVFSDDT
uniref:Reverse transcriptase Ty1/copia-type domain-containing protein n=1 Tax=Tanacetum cinerariifolium TaxID=118510 RepID=A0A699H7H8_TANCI|nr:hypothetical protein [Tanacetum cinerariifolium]